MRGNKYLMEHTQEGLRDRVGSLPKALGWDPKELPQLKMKFNGLKGAGAPSVRELFLSFFG